MSAADVCLAAMVKMSRKVQSGNAQNNGCVDRLSLALALRNDKDERIEQAVEEMTNQVWSQL